MMSLCPSIGSFICPYFQVSTLCTKSGLNTKSILCTKSKPSTKVTFALKFSLCSKINPKLKVQFVPNVHLALKVKSLLKLHLQKVTFPQEFAIEVYYTLNKKNFT